MGQCLTSSIGAEFGAWYPRFDAVKALESWKRFTADMRQLFSERLRKMPATVLWRTYTPSHFGDALQDACILRHEECLAILYRSVLNWCAAEAVWGTRRLFRVNIHTCTASLLPMIWSLNLRRPSAD